MSRDSTEAVERFYAREGYTTKYEMNANPGGDPNIVEREDRPRFKECVKDGCYTLLEKRSPYTKCSRCRAIDLEQESRRGRRSRSRAESKRRAELEKGGMHGVR